MLSTFIVIYKSSYSWKSFFFTYHHIPLAYFLSFKYLTSEGAKHGKPKSNGIFKFLLVYPLMEVLITMLLTCYMYLFCYVGA
jgi:hypothetical protein